MNADGARLDRRRRGWTLAAILVVAATLRLAALTHSPPGLNADEAVNGWNAWCLLKTGATAAGTRWPIFYHRALGESSTLFLYWTMPFQWLAGLSVWSTRLPAAAGGVLAVWLIYRVGSRWLDQATGLVAAGLLAVDPWHVQLSRWGHEASISPLLVLAPLALMIAARLPPVTGPPRRVLALAAGLATGIACYGYPAVRLALPALIGLIGLGTIRSWIALARTPRGLIAVLLYGAGVAATLGPLMWSHVADAEGISRRYDAYLVWNWWDGPLTRVAKVMQRYAAHFDPAFLFVRGDGYEVNHAPFFGQFLPYMAVPMGIGAVMALRRARRSTPARLLFLGLLAYPLGDVLHQHGVGHALRSAPGLPFLVLVAAYGAVEGGRWLRTRSAGLSWTAGGLLGLSAIALHVLFFTGYFRDYPRRPAVAVAFHADLARAAALLESADPRPDRVVITTRELRPDMTLPVILRFDPRAWMAEPRDYRAWGEWHVYLSYGRYRFLYEVDSLERELRKVAASAGGQRAWFILWHDEADAWPELGAPLATFGESDDAPRLCVYERGF